MKKIILLPLLFSGLLCYSQVTNRIQADSVKIYQVGGNGAELILENSSKNLTGAFLKNKLNGRTYFGYALDSVWKDSNLLNFRYGPNTLSFAISGITQGTLDDTAAAIRQYIDTATNRCEDKLIYGGSVTYTGSGYNFYVQDAKYQKNCIEYVTDSGSVTMPPSDPTYDFFVLIYLDTDGQFHTRAGAPAESAKIPQAEGDEWPLTAIKVSAGSTVPDFSSIYVYNENVEGWTVTNIGTTTNPDATGNAWNGTKAINVTVWNNGDVIGLKRSAGTVNVANASAFSLAVDLKQTMVNQANIGITFFGNGVAVSSERNISINKQSLVYQLTSIPMDLFGMQSYDVDSIRIRYLRPNNSSVHAGVHLDYIHWIFGFTQPPSGTTVQSVAVNAPSFITATVTPGTGNVVINLVANSTSAALVYGDGVARTDDKVNDVGAYNSLGPDPRGAQVSAKKMYFHDANDTIPGMFNPYYKKSVDTLKQYTVEELSSVGIPIMTAIDPYRTGFKRIILTNDWGYTDSTILIDTTGTGANASSGEGIVISNDSANLGGLIGSPSLLLNERNIRMNRKILHFTNGMDAEAGGDIWQWSYRSYSPFLFRTKDTVTSNDMPYSANMPVAALHAQRDIYYAPGVYRQYGIYGHRLAYYHYGTDSFVVRSDGDDYNQAVIAESRYRSTPGYTGRTLIQTSHSNASFMTEGPAALVGNVIVGNDVAGARVFIKGQLNGVVSYLVTQGMNADTIQKHNFFKPRTFISAPGKLLKGIIYASGPIGGDSVWYLMDSIGYRSYLHGGLSLGGGYTGILNQFRNHFNSYLRDSVAIETIRNWNDSTNMDIVLSPRTGGSHALRKIRFDELSSYISGGSISGSGSADEIPVFSGTSTLTSSPALKWNGGTLGVEGFGDFDDILITNNIAGAPSADSVNWSIQAEGGGGVANNLIIRSLDQSFSPQALSLRFFRDGRIEHGKMNFYSGNFASLYNSRSLVDKNYVDSSIAAGGGGGGGSGTVNSGTANRLAYYPSTGTTVDDLAAITANRAIKSDANGLPVHSTVTDTELERLSGVTSSVQTQIDNKQDYIGEKRVFWVAPASSTTVATVGVNAYTTSGTLSTPTPTTTNLLTSTRRTSLSTGTSAGASARVNNTNLEVWRGNAAGLGGFKEVFRWGLNTTQTGNRVFVGLTSTASALTNVDHFTNTAIDRVGCYIDAASGNWFLIHNTSGSAATSIDLGSNFAVNTTDLLELKLVAAPNASTISYTVNNLSTGNTTSGTLSTNLPTATNWLAQHIWCNNNAQSAAVIVDMVKMYSETNY